MKNVFAPACAALALAAFAGSALAQGVPATAQTYRASVATPSAFTNTPTFEAVPLGKRLIVTNASCSVGLQLNAKLKQAEFRTSMPPNKDVGFAVVGNGTISAVNDLTYSVQFGGGAIFHAGEKPYMVLGTSGNMNWVNFCSINGYLIADK